MVSPARRAILVLTFVLAFAGCTHCPSFERERVPDPGPAPVLSRSVVIVTRYDGSVDPVLRDRLDGALRAEGSVERVHRARPSFATPEDALDLTVSVEPRARAAGKNFLIAWPGFIVFAPAWHGFEWIYRVRTTVRLTREGAGAVPLVYRDDKLLAHATSNALGVGAGAGWYPPGFSVPALVTGILAVSEAPETRHLDHEFALREGDDWARIVAGDILRALHARSTSEPSRPSSP